MLEEYALWEVKMMKRDRFHFSQKMVLTLAKHNNALFENYTEYELYICYLMLMNLFTSIDNANDLVKKAIEFMEDDFAKVSGSEKLYIYYTQIFLGEE